MHSTWSVENPFLLHAKALIFLETDFDSNQSFHRPVKSGTHLSISGSLCRTVIRSLVLPGMPLGGGVLVRARGTVRVMGDAVPAMRLRGQQKVRVYLKCRQIIESG